jgi:phosphate transport system protein
MHRNAAALAGAAIFGLGEKSEAVILGDRELDAFEIEMDDACVQLLALQQPMARDLRLITMSMRVANDLERVGDHAVNMAQATRHLVQHPPFAPTPALEEMARLAREMLSDALDHFVRGDAEHATCAAATTGWTRSTIRSSARCSHI